jgi:hypothetical protein
LNASGRQIVLSTEPFSIVPTPLEGESAHMYRTTNDVEASYSSSMNRLDSNANWWRHGGPGRFPDPDCIMCGHGGVNEAECRSVFAVFCIVKAPLLLGAVLQNMSTTTLATLTNRGLLALNQDPLGIPGRKLSTSVRGVTPHHVGLASCTTANTAPGVNGVTVADLQWAPRPLPGSNGSSVALVHTATGRCLAARPYLKRPTPVPVLLPCNASDPSQAWALPRPTSVGPLLNAALNASLAVGASTLYGAPHDRDNATLLDAAYGLTNLTFAPRALEPPCTSRDCDQYDPTQSWYWSPRTGRLSLALFSANLYRCYEGSSGCYYFTSHAPATDDLCLTRVQVISNDGLDTDVGGVHAWGGPLAGGDYGMVLENRDATDAPAALARWEWLEAPGIDSTTQFCVRELYADKVLGRFTGGLTLPLPTHDAVALRLSLAATC